MERAENRHGALARKKANGIEDVSEPINETLDGQMNRLEAYLHRMVQATEGVSNNNNNNKIYLYRANSI